MLQDSRKRMLKNNISSKNLGLFFYINLNFNMIQDYSKKKNLDINIDKLTLTNIKYGYKKSQSEM